MKIATRRPIASADCQSYLVAQPTIETMRLLLDEMEANGWPSDQHVEMKPIANMLGAFVVRVVDPNA